MNKTGLRHFKYIGILASLILLTFLIGCSRITSEDIDRVLEESWSLADESPGMKASTPVDSPYFNLVAEIDNAPSSPTFHYVQLIENGEDSLATRLHLIRSARKSIDIQTFIWHNDDVGRLIFDELLEAAQRGVRVRVILDQVSALKNPYLAAQLTALHRNFHPRVYNPPKTSSDDPFWNGIWEMIVGFNRINQRMHNKLMIFDGQIGVTGGRNLGNEYFDLDEHFNFKDRDALIVGPAVKKMIRSFEEYWDYQDTRALRNMKDVKKRLVSEDFKPLEVHESELIPPLEFIDSKADSLVHVRRLMRESLYKTDGKVTYWADEPGGPDTSDGADNPALFIRFMDILNGIQQEYIMQTPYLIYSGKGKRRLKELIKIYPNIQFVISTNSLASTNHAFVYGISYRQRKFLLKKAKAEVYEMKPNPADIEHWFPILSMPFPDEKNKEKGSSRSPYVGLHAKSFVIDNNATYIGTHNFDPRSSNINTECGIYIEDYMIASAVKEDILLLTSPQNSWPSAKRKRTFIFSPAAIMRYFDLWPFRYGSLYELREGAEPATPGTSKFYENYEPLGNFPGVQSRAKAATMVYVSIFGAWTAKWL